MVNQTINVGYDYVADERSGGAGVGGNKSRGRRHYKPQTLQVTGCATLKSANVLVQVGALLSHTDMLVEVGVTGHGICSLFMSAATFEPSLRSLLNI